MSLPISPIPARSFMTARTRDAEIVGDGQGNGWGVGLSNRSGVILRVAGVATAALLLANCAGQMERQGAKQDRYSKKYGVNSSPRVVREGQPIPKGGGRAMVGKPYTVAGKRYTPVDNPGYTATGVASWYGPNFHGRMTANGEVFDKQSIAAAHPTLPLPSYVRVTNLDNGLSLVVRVNDRGPYHGRRVIDVSRRAAELLEFRRMGTARVKVDYIRRASVNGSDDVTLASTLSENGPARLDGGQSPVMVASAQERMSRETAPQSSRQSGETPLAGSGVSEMQVASLAPHHMAAQAQARDSVDETASALPLTAPLPPIRPIVVASGG